MHQSTKLLAYFRGVRLACHIIYGLVLACFFSSLKQNLRNKIMKRWSHALLDILNVKLQIRGCNELADREGRIWVANHVSWLDVFALNAVVPACFVAKSEIRDWPILGWLCHRTGTLFVKRNIRRDTLRINREIQSTLEQGEGIALFPEGTSTIGDIPTHFHSSLFQSAIDLNETICPVAIRYHDGAGVANSDAAFIGDMTFTQSLWKVMCSPSLHVTLLYLPPLSSEGKNRRLLASEARESIHSGLVKFFPNHALYHPVADTAPNWDIAVPPVEPAEVVS